MKASVVCLLFASLLVIVLPRGSKGHNLKMNVEQEEILRENFKEYDTDNNGYISLDELRITSSENGLNGFEGFLMERLDTNKDNQISFEEFQDLSQTSK